MTDDRDAELVDKAVTSLTDIGLALAAHNFSIECLHDRHTECAPHCRICNKPCRCGCHGSAENLERTEAARRASQFAAREQLATQTERSDRWARKESDDV